MLTVNEDYLLLGLTEDEFASGIANMIKFVMKNKNKQEKLTDILGTSNSVTDVLLMEDGNQIGLE